MKTTPAPPIKGTERLVYALETDDGTVIAWLVEYIGASPCPVYISETGDYTCDPWKAKKFRSQRGAQTWMSGGRIPLRYPWEAVQHSFAPAMELNQKAAPNRKG